MNTIPLRSRSHGSTASKRTKTRQRDKHMTQYLNSITSLKGKAPANPFRSLRETGTFIPSDGAVIDTNLLVEGAEIIPIGLSIQAIADKIGVSKQALIRTEQGVYPDPPERIVNYYVHEHNVDYLVLRNGYEYYQRTMRQRHNQLFGPDLKIFEAYSYSWLDEPVKHPFDVLKECWFDPAVGNYVGLALNTTQIAKLWCLSQATLDHFENRVNQQATVPQALSQAFLDAGYTVADLKLFSDAYEYYRNNLLGITNLKLVDD